MVQSKVFQQQQMLRRKQQASRQGQRGQQRQGQGQNAPNAKAFGNGLQSGFFNHNTAPAPTNNQSGKQGKGKKLTKREKMELKRQQKQMRNSSAQMQQESITAPDGTSHPQHTQPRRRKKGKHKF